MADSSIRLYQLRSSNTWKYEEDWLKAKVKVEEIQIGEQRAWWISDSFWIFDLKISSWSLTWEIKSSSYSSNQNRSKLRFHKKSTWVNRSQLKTDRLRSLNRGKAMSRIISYRCSNWIHWHDKIKVRVRERWVTWVSLISLKREQEDHLRERGIVMNVLNKSLSSS